MATETKTKTYYNDTEGDIHFTTSDNVSFKASRIFLSYASRVFREMFAAGHLPDGRNEGSESDPIKIDATADVFDAVMRLVYPAPPPDFTQDKMGSLLPDVISFCAKFMMEDVTLRLRNELVHPNYLKKHPVRAYLIACKWKWKTEETSAMQAAIQYHYFHSMLPSIPEMDNVPARKTNQLSNINRAFRRMLSDLIDSLLEDRYDKDAEEFSEEMDPYLRRKDVWAPRCICNPEMKWNKCEFDYDASYWEEVPPKWFNIYKSNAWDEQQSGSLPTDATSSVELLFKAGLGSDCKGCWANILAHWRRFDKIPGIVSKELDGIKHSDTNEKLLAYMGGSNGSHNYY